MPSQSSKPIIPDYARPASTGPLIQRSESRLGVCLLIRPANWTSIARMITLGSMVLVPPLVMLLVVFLVTSNPRLRVGSIWPTIALAAFATVAVVWYLVVTFHRSYQPTIIEIRDGRLIVRDESTFNDWPIDRITSIRAESRNLGPSQYNYGQRPGNLMNLVPQPHLEISVTGRDVSRVLYQYSMPELEQIAKALRDELDK